MNEVIDFNYDKKILNIMEKYGFKFVKETNEIYTFIGGNNVNKKVDVSVICEVSRKFNDNSYQFIYTNEYTFGMLKSGVLTGLDDENFFFITLNQFMITVNRIL